MNTLTGIEPYSASPRKITIEQHGPHVLLTLEHGIGTGEVLLTPGQACALAHGLKNEAANAEAHTWE